MLGNPVDVVVAARALERGTTLAADDLAVRRIPSVYAPPGVLHAGPEAVGGVLVAGLAPGEPLTRTRLAGTHAGPVAALVPTGLRAFAVASGIASGMVRPGDRVDVLATFGGQRPYTETVAEGLEVARVMGTEPGPGSGPSPSTATVGQAATVVLLVDPAQAERLAHAAALGTIAIAVAPPSDLPPTDAAPTQTSVPR